MKLTFFLYFFLTENIFGFPIHQKRHISPSLRIGKICQPTSLIPLSMKPAKDIDTVTKSSPTHFFTALTTSFLLFPSIASAASPDWGLFEGRTGSLLHPITMFALLALSVNAAVLGFNWRRQRTIGDEITMLKKSLPKFEGNSLSGAIEKAKAAEVVDMSLVKQYESAIPIAQQVESLTKERKELSQQKNREKHYNRASLVAFLGTSFAIIGPLNTYSRAGKLFPGPHLYAGAGLVIAWALAVSMIPHMQSGKHQDVARNVHIGSNLFGIGLFAWQVQSGIPILLKVWEKTQWP